MIALIGPLGPIEIIFIVTLMIGIPAGVILLIAILLLARPTKRNPQVISTEHATQESHKGEIT